VEVDRPALLPARLTVLPFVREVMLEGHVLSIVVAGDEDYRAQLSREIIAAGATILSMDMREANLEETFLAATARPAQATGAS
jgi:hypothetical protein